MMVKIGNYQRQDIDISGNRGIGKDVCMYIQHQLYVRTYVHMYITLLLSVGRYLYVKMTGLAAYRSSTNTNIILCLNWYSYLPTTPIMSAAMSRSKMNVKIKPYSFY